MKKMILLSVAANIILLGALYTDHFFTKSPHIVPQNIHKSTIEASAVSASSTQKITTSDLAQFFNKRFGPCRLKGEEPFDCFTDQFVVADRARDSAFQDPGYTLVDFSEPGYEFHGVFVTLYWSGTASFRSVYALTRDPDNGSLVLVYVRPGAAFDTQTKCIGSRGRMYGTCFVQTQGDDGRRSGVEHPSVTIPVKWDSQDRVFFENDR